jgi:hypothetical protein
VNRKQFYVSISRARYGVTVYTDDSSVVGAVFRLAIKRGQYSKNPVDSVERAVQPARELSTDGSPAGTGTDAIDPDSVLSPKEIQTLLQEAKPGFERTLFETAYLTGARERTSCAAMDGSRAVERKDRGKW